MFLGCFLEIFGTFWVVTHLKDSDGPGEGGPSQENEFSQLRSTKKLVCFFSPFFDISGVGVFPMSINTVLLPMLLPWVFPRGLGVAVSPLRWRLCWRVAIANWRNCSLSSSSYVCSSQPHRRCQPCRVVHPARRPKLVRSSWVNGKKNESWWK